MNLKRKKNLPDQFEGSRVTAPPSEASIISLLGKIAPEKVKEAVAAAAEASAAAKAVKAVQGEVEDVVDEVPKSDKGSVKVPNSELAYPTQP